MKKLSQIASLVTSNSDGWKTSLAMENPAKLDRLLHGLMKGEFKRDEDAATSLFQTSAKSKSYLMLKSRLKERLLDRFFQMDSERLMNSRYDKMYYQCMRNVFAGQIMITKDMRGTATELFKSTLSHTQQYYFTDLSLVILRWLRFDASQNGDKQKWNYYDKLVKHYTRVQQAEYSAEKYTQMIVVEFARKTPSDKQIKRKAASCYKKICTLSSKYKSYPIELNKFRTGARYYTIIGEHRKAINLVNQTERYLQDHPHLIQKVRLAEMALFRMDSCLAIRDSENGLLYASQCEKYFNRGTINWLIFREYDFLLCMHTGNYRRALEIFYEVFEHPKFPHQNPQRHEKWKIFEAFLNYALPAQLPKRNFNLFKFLNEIRIYTKDKRGYNFATLVAEIILLVEIGDIDKLIDIAEPFRVYVDRYVSRKNNLRSYYFSKLLLVLFKYQFDPLKSEQIGRKFLQRLYSITPEYNGGLESIEVIPYDKLWGLLLSKLKEEGFSNVKERVKIKKETVK